MHRIDDNDLAHVLRLGLDPVAWAPCPRSEDGAINPQVTRFALANGQWADVVQARPAYYQHADGGWRPLSEVCSRHGNHHIAIRPDRMSWVHPAFLIWLMRRQRALGSELVFGGPGYAGVQPRHLEFAATLTAYPDKNPEVTTVDGYISYAAAFATAQPASTGDTASDSGATFRVQADPTFLARGFLLFSTAAIGSGSTSLSGVLSVFIDDGGKTNNDNDGDDWVNVVQSNPASNTALATTDWNQCGDAVTNPTEGATRVDISSTTADAWCDWTLNATGNGWISKTGITKLGLREGHDCINSTPAAANALRLHSADTFDSVPPKLVVTYTPPPAGLLGDPLRAFQHMIMR